MKKYAFTILEILFVISIIFISYKFIKIKNVNNELNNTVNTLLLNLKNLRYQALIDNKFSLDEKKWFKKKWTLKFFNCNKNIGGIYYLMYSDLNMKGHVNKSETLKDSLNDKYLYTTSNCEETNDTSKNVLLSKEFNIKNVKVSCNNTSSIGQISFSYDGKIYNSLSSQNNNNIIEEDCFIKITHNNGEYKRIIINPLGYSRIEKD